MNLTATDILDHIAELDSDDLTYVIKEATDLQQLRVSVQRQLQTEDQAPAAPVDKYAPVFTSDHGDGIRSEYYAVDRDTRVTRVTMANGEVRYFVKVYNGYCSDDADMVGSADPRKFGCAWSPSFELTLPDGEPVRTLSAVSDRDDIESARSTTDEWHSMVQEARSRRECANVLNRMTRAELAAVADLMYLEWQTVSGTSRPASTLRTVILADRWSVETSRRTVAN